MQLSRTQYNSMHKKNDAIIAQKTHITKKNVQKITKSNVVYVKKHIIHEKKMQKNKKNRKKLCINVRLRQRDSKFNNNNTLLSTKW